MESNYNLESLREISLSQLDVLLRYDSPPETPIQATESIKLSGVSIDEDRNENNINNQPNSFNCSLYPNREQLTSQCNSQIDFSIFHHNIPNENHDIISKIPDIENVTLDNDLYIGLKSVSQKSGSDTTVFVEKRTDDDLVEIDNIIEEIDFEYISNLKENNLNKSCNHSWNPRPKSNLQNQHKRIIFSCPEPITKSQTLAFSSSSKSLSSQNVASEKLCAVKSNPKLSGNRTETNYLDGKCISLNSNLYDKLDDIDDDIFRTLDFEYSSTTTQGLSQAQSHLNQQPLTNRSNFKNFPPTNLSDYITKDKQENYTNISHSKSLTDNNFKEIDEIFNSLDFEGISNESGSTQVQPQSHLNAPPVVDENVITIEDQAATCSKPTNDNERTNENIYDQNASWLKPIKSITKCDSSSIPSSVKNLYEIVKTKYSDFAFIYALSCQLCQDRVPMECFVTLKMALLLSLVSIGNNTNQTPIPIVAMTNDTYMTNYLMTNIGQLASRFIGPVNDTKSYTNSNWIEADPILLAQGGVYYAGDWTRLKLKKTETIFNNIECSRIGVEKSNLTFPLETAVWTHWRSFKAGAKDQKMFNKFLKIFGLPIFVSDDNHEALVDYTLEQTSVRCFESTVDHLSVNEDDMRNFLVYASQLNVDLSPEAALLLKNYFVASRSDRQDCLTMQSYIMLKQFAESFAKLSMHKIVLADDALAAIVMCEHFIEHVFSSSDSSPPHFGKFAFIGTVDGYLFDFKKWLNSYIKKFINE